MAAGLDPGHVTWCRSLFDTLNEGGVWGVPRSGLIFRKDGDALVLYATMPHDEEMPLTSEELREQQEDEFESVRAHFGAAGVDVRREEKDGN